VAGERSTAYLRAEFQEVEAVETPDPRTVRIVMKRPTITLPLLLAGPHFPVIARNSEATAPIGAGPYKISAQERGVSITCTAFDRYYKPGLPKTPTIRFVAYPDENLRVAALQAGDIDLIEYVPWQTMAAIEADPRLKLDTTNGPFMDLMFNGRTGPFRDPRVRRATGFAIRREDIVQSAFFGRGSPLRGLPLTPGTEFWDERRANLFTYDPERAKALLAEAGVAGGFACTLLSTAQYGMHQSTAEVVQQHLAEVGIRVQLNLPDWATRVAMGNRGQYEFCVQGQTSEYNDPDGLSQLIDGELPPNVGRSFGLATPRIHELLVAGRSEFDAARRRAIYAELEQLAFEEAPMVGLAWRSQGYAMARDVQGFKNLPGALTFFSGITLEDVSFG
jgi:peptide/nickel transport system substrate-binding protein